MKKVKYAMLAVLMVVGFSVSAGEKTVDTEKSELAWLGEKVTGEHSGTIKIKSGVLNLNNGNIKSGEFVIDMTSLIVTDLSGDMKGKLEGHLKSDDFFGVANFPESKLVITKASSFKNGVAKLSADLTIKGKTHPVSFDVTQQGVAYTATISVDRTLYNVRYGSGKFFDNLGDKTIYDIFKLDVKLVLK